MDLVNLYFYLTYSSALSILIPIVCCLIYFKAFNSILKALFLYLIFSLVIEILSFIFSSNGINTGNIFSLYTVIETSIIAYIYFKEFRIAFKTGLTIYLTVIAIVLLSIVFQNKYGHIASSVEAIFTISLALLYFYKIFTDLSIPKLTQYYFFWLNSAFLLYFSTAFFLFLFEKHIGESDNLVMNFLWAINLAVNIIFNILLSIGVCKVKQTSLS